MARKLKIFANDAPFSAYPGDILLDAALHQGINLPHDCRSGQCGSCLVRVVQGEVLGGETPQRHVVHACQARVFSDVQIRYDKLPAVRKLTGKLVRIERLAPDIRGLTIKLEERANHRPGQYYRVKFRGFPTRCFSPTAPFVGNEDRGTLRLHVKVVRGGEVTSRLETDIRLGHRLGVEGPFGSAFFRPGEGGRLILVSGGTGFAPIWAIAQAALRRQPHRPLLLIAGSRRLSSLYMAQALCRLAVHPAARFVATTQEAHNASQIVRQGTPDQHLPEICPSDIVYAAGSQALVETVGDAAARAGAAFYADPFVASSRPEGPWLNCRIPQLRFREVKSRIVDWFSNSAREQHLSEAIALSSRRENLYPGTQHLHEGMGMAAARRSL